MATTRQIRKKYRELIDQLKEIPGVHQTVKDLLLEHAKRLDNIAAHLREVSPRNSREDGYEAIQRTAVSYIKNFDFPLPLWNFSKRFSKSVRNYGGIALFVENMTEVADAPLLKVVCTDGRSFIYDRERWANLDDWRKSQYLRTDQEREAERQVLIAQKRAAEEAERLANRKPHESGLPFDPEDYSTRKEWKVNRIAELVMTGLTHEAARDKMMKELMAMLLDWKKRTGQINPESLET